MPTRRLIQGFPLLMRFARRRWRLFLSGVLLVLLAVAWYVAVDEMLRPSWPSSDYRRERKLYPCEPATPACRADGDLGEWRDALWLPLGDAAGPELRVAMRWSPDALFVAARVRDDRVVAQPFYGDFHGDALQISLWRGRGRKPERLLLVPPWPRRCQVLALVGGHGGGEARIEDVSSILPKGDLGLRFDAEGMPWLAAADVTGRRGAAEFGEGFAAHVEDGGGRRVRRAWGRRAEMRLPLLASGPARLVLRASPGPADGGQRVAAWLNGVSLGASPAGGWSSAADVSFDLPDSAIRRDGVNRLLLDFDRTSDAVADRMGRGLAATIEDVRILRRDERVAAPRMLVAGDADGDGWDDVCGYASGRLFAWSPRTAWAWAGGGDMPQPRCLAVGDVDNDGAPDVAALEPDAAALRLCTPSDRAERRVPLAREPAFRDEPRAVAAHTWRALLVADVNRDGENELVGLGDNGIEVVVLRDGEWRGVQRVEAPATGWLFWQDFDGDDRPELALVASGSDVTEMRFYEPTPIGLRSMGSARIGMRAVEAAAGDLDGDGCADLLLSPGADGGERRFVVCTPRSRSVVPWRRLPAGGPLLVGEFLASATPADPPMSAAVYRHAPSERPDAPRTPRFLPRVGGVSCAVARTAEGYSLEAAVPWAALGVKAPRPGDRLGLRLVYLDADDPYGKGREVAYAGVGRVVEIEALPSALPAALGAEHARFLGALTAFRSDATCWIAGEQREIEVIKGATPGRMPRVAGILLEGENGGLGRGARVEASDRLGTEVETWRVGPAGLNDGGVEMSVLYAVGETTADTRGLAESRARLYARSRSLAAQAADMLRPFVGRWPDHAPALIYRAQSCLAQLEGLAEKSDRSALAGLGREIEYLARAARGIAAGRPPKDKDASGQRAYWSDIDDSPQPYALGVPKGYDASREWPLVVSLHGAGSDPARRVSASAWDEALVLAPHGRGWTDYMSLGEADVMRAIDEVCRRYRVDLDRIYLMGSSMGGTGCWHLAGRYPDRFAAIAPVCGNSDTAVWDMHWGPAWPAGDPRSDLRRRVRHLLDPITFACNLVNVPLLAAHGGRDRVVYVEASRRMVGALREAGAAPIYREEPSAGHGLPQRALADRKAWLLAQSRARAPRRVQLAVAEDRHASAWWLRALPDRHPLALAEVDAEVHGPNDIRVDARHVRGLDLDLNAWRQEQSSRLSVGEALVEPWEGIDARCEPTEDGMRITGDGVGVFPRAVVSLPQVESSDAGAVRLGLWLRAGRTACGEVEVAVFQGDLEPPPAPGESRTTQPLARVVVRPTARWEYLELTARPDSDASEPLRAALVLGGQPSDGEVEVRDVRVSEGDRPSSLFCRQPAEPALWLDSSVRRPGGAFPWAFLNRLADLPRALPLDLPGVGEVRDVGPQGRVTAPFCVDGPAGEPYVAAVWARGGDMRLSLVAADGRRELASALARASADWKAALLAWPRWAHTAQARLRVEAAGAEPVQVCGAFVARGRTPPDAWTAPRQPGAVDLAASIRVSLNGRKAFDGPAPPDGVVRLVVPPSPPAGLCKTDILKGPIAHAFESPFLLVYGTGGDDRDWRVAFEEAWSFRDEWKARCGVPCRIRADREVGDEDARRFNLVLFGGPTVNSVAARVMPAMPVRIEGGAAVAGERRFAGEDVGVKVIYPNPLNPDRYVAVFAGVTWRGMFQITRRFGAWFGWRVHEHRDWYDFVVFDDVSRDPASFLLVGWFDERWRMAGETTWEGDAAWRAGAPRRAVPILAGPDPDCDETWLSEMEPWRSTLRLGAVGLDRSFRGNALRPGGVECRRGLGVRIEGGVAYDLRGMCDRFRAIVGIDNEGETPTAERQAVTRVRFEVWGDGRRLAWSATHHWNDPPETMDADVRGVRILELRAVGMGSRPWVYGSVAWGEARVSLAR